MTDGAEVRAEKMLCRNIEDGSFYHATMETVYVETGKTGSGAEGYPCGDMRTAIDMVMPGGTIVITGKGIQVNDLADAPDSPLDITKAITITGESDDINDNTLTLRSGGIILSEDVTFEKVKVVFTNSVNPGIFANGHTLTLKDTSVDSGVYGGDVFAGGLEMEVGTQRVKYGTEGSFGQIIMSGTHTSVDDIFAGGVGCDFGNPYDTRGVSISLSDCFAGVGNLYCYGKDVYAVYVDYSIDIELKDNNITAIYGTESGNLVNVNFSAKSMKEIAFYNIFMVSVKEGELVPRALNSSAYVGIESEGILNLSKLMAENNGTYSLAGLQGNGGTLKLRVSDTLIFGDMVTGTTPVAVLNNNGYPAEAEKNHTYIDTSNLSDCPESAFVLVPYSEASSLELVNTDGLWQAVQTTGEKTALEEDKVSVAFVDGDSIYNGKEKAIQVTVLNSANETLSRGTHYIVNFYRGNERTQDYIQSGEITVEVVGIGSYSGTITKTVTIQKAAYPDTLEDITADHKYKKTGEQTLVVAPELNEDVGTISYKVNTAGIQDNSAILEGTPSIDDKTGKVTYTLAGKSAYTEGMKAVIPILIVTDNYADITVNLIVNLADNTPQANLELTASADTVVYDQSVTLSVKGGSGSGKITYEISGAWTARQTGKTLAAKRAGTITVVAIKAGDTEYQEARSNEIEIRIEQAVPSVVPTITSVRQEGYTLADIALVNHTGIEGEFFWIDESKNPLDSTLLEQTRVEENVVYSWVFEPKGEDAVNYTSVTGTAVPWKYDSSNWRGSLQTYYERIITTRREIRQEHDQKQREQQEKYRVIW